MAAIDAFKTAVSLDPTEAAHHVELCKALRMHDRAADALSVIIQATAIIPDSDAVALHAAYTHHADGAMNLALQHYSRSAQIYREHGAKGPAPMNSKASGLVAVAMLSSLQQPSIPLKCPQLPMGPAAGLPGAPLVVNPHAHIWPWDHSQTKMPDWLRRIPSFAEAAASPSPPLLFVLREQGSFGPGCYSLPAEYSGHNHTRYLPRRLLAALVPTGAVHVQGQAAAAALLDASNVRLQYQKKGYAVLHNVVRKTFLKALATNVEALS